MRVQLGTLCLLAILLGFAADCSGYRILGLFPLNGKSHFAMPGRLMQALAERGHQVDVVSHFPLDNPPANYRDISLKGSVPEVVNNFTAARALTMVSMSSSIHIFMQKSGYAYCQLLRHPKIRKIIDEPPKDPPYDLVIVEVFSQHCFMAFARHLKVPLLGIAATTNMDWLDPSIGNPNNPAYVQSMSTAVGQRMDFWQRLINTYHHVWTVLQFNYYVTNQDSIVSELFGPNMPSTRDLPADLSVVLVNSHPSLNDIRPNMPNVIEVGGMHLPDEKSGDFKLPPDVQKFLDDSKHGCVYFTFGSMVTIESFPRNFLDVFYGAFEKIAPVRVLLKIADSSKLPAKLPTNVLAKPWFSQPAVLRHKNIRAFVTHGGLMGSYEAIYYGVPMIGLPLFGDQHTNINRYVEKKIALSLNLRELTVDKFANSILAVVKDPVYKQNIERLSRLMFDRPMSPIDTAIFWTEYAARNGPVLRSPLLDLTWWQLAQLDVYGFVIGCLSAIIAFVVAALRILYRRYRVVKEQPKNGRKKKTQ